jgi:hypothetical protein
MPKPLIILDHHLSSASKYFLIKHLQEFKALGYQKILLEMNQDVVFSDFKRQMRFLSKLAHQDKIEDRIILSMNGLLDAIEAADMPCEFIDPEPLAVAKSFDHRLKLARTPAEVLKVKVLREEATAKRDVYMAAKVLEESKLFNGGVITFVGFKHQELLKRLTGEGLDYASVLLDHTLDSRAGALSSVLDFDLRDWLSMSNPLFRYEHYRQEVAYLDWAQSMPFYAIKALLGLTKEKSLTHLPLVARYLSEEMDAPCEFKVDEEYHLHAFFPVEDEPKLQTKFPGLRFFQSRDKICVPGINLKEQQEKIPAPCKI